MKAIDQGTLEKLSAFKEIVFEMRREARHQGRYPLNEAKTLALLLKDERFIGLPVRTVKKFYKHTLEVEPILELLHSEDPSAYFAKQLVEAPPREVHRSTAKRRTQKLHKQMGKILSSLLSTRDIKAQPAFKSPSNVEHRLWMRLREVAPVLRQWGREQAIFVKDTQRELRPETGKPASASFFSQLKGRTSDKNILFSHLRGKQTRVLGKPAEAIIVEVAKKGNLPYYRVKSPQELNSVNAYWLFGFCQFPKIEIEPGRSAVFLSPKGVEQFLEDERQAEGES